MKESTTHHRIVGAVTVLVSAIGVVVALTVQPFKDWGAFGYILGACVVGLGAVGAWWLLSGTGRILGTGSPRRQRAVALSGLGLTSVIILSSVIEDWRTWDAADVLAITFWLSSAITYVATFWLLPSDSTDSSPTAPTSG